MLMTKETKDYKEKESLSIEKLLCRIRTEDTLMSVFLVRRSCKMGMEELSKNLPPGEFNKSWGSPQLNNPLPTEMRKYIFGVDAMRLATEKLILLDGSYKKLVKEFKHLGDENRRFFLLVLSTKNGRILNALRETADEMKKETRKIKKRIYS